MTRRYGRRCNTHGMIPLRCNLLWCGLQTPLPLIRLSSCSADKRPLSRKICTWWTQQLCRDPTTQIFRCREVSVGSGVYSDYANSHGALQIWPEHRYYAQSSPYTPVDNLAHFTIEQALVDHVELVLYIQNTLNMTRNPVIALGSSYSESQPPYPVLDATSACCHSPNWFCKLIRTMTRMPFVHIQGLPKAISQHTVLEACLVAVLLVLGAPSNTTPEEPGQLRNIAICCKGVPHIKFGCVFVGAQLASYLRMRYPDVIAGAVSSSPTSFGCPGLGLV